MPETINGWELFQLPCGKESGETVGYAEFVNPLGADGHVASVLYGADTGLRRFNLPYDGLAGYTSQSSITVGGVTMSKAKYIRDLFRRHKVSGVPFVIQSVENNNYYLARFDESEQSLTRKLTAMYATQINLVQERIDGVTVFDPLKMSGVWSWWKGDLYTEIVNEATTTYRWTDQTGQLHYVDGTSTTNLTHVADVHNGLGVFRFNAGVSPNGYFSRNLSPVIYEAFLLMKMREATFSNYAGILTANTGTAALLGDNGTTKFFNQSIGSAYEYRKNSVLFPENDQQAPMNEFGLVHLRFQNGIGLANLQIGKDRAATDRYAKMDLLGGLLLTTLNPLSDSLECAEHLQEWADI